MFIGTIQCSSNLLTGMTRTINRNAFFLYIGLQVGTDNKTDDAPAKPDPGKHHKAEHQRNRGRNKCRGKISQGIKTSDSQCRRQPHLDHKHFIIRTDNKAIHPTDKKRGYCNYADPERTKSQIRYHICPEIKLANGVTKPDQNGKSTDIKKN